MFEWTDKDGDTWRLLDAQEVADFEKGDVPPLEGLETPGERFEREWREAATTGRLCWPLPVARNQWWHSFSLRGARSTDALPELRQSV